MKTEANLYQCESCRTWFNPDTSRTDCPHSSLTESPMLKKLRQAGPPYKVEVFRRTLTEVLNEIGAEAKNETVS